MKKLRSALYATILTLVLTPAALAGDIGSPRLAAAGDIGSPKTAAAPVAGDIGSPKGDFATYLFVTLLSMIW
jgi:hypothetical protein